MPEYLAPGVYVEETSFRAKSIEGVGTSTTAFVGPTRKGPVVPGTEVRAELPEVLTSFADFVRMYGGLEPLSFTNSAPNYLAQSVFNYFNEGGTRLYVMRVAANDAKGAQALLASTPDAGDGNRVVIRSRFVGSGTNGSIIFREILSSGTAGAFRRAPIGTLARKGDSLFRKVEKPNDAAGEWKSGNDVLGLPQKDDDLVPDTQLIQIAILVEEDSGELQVYDNLSFAPTDPQYVGRLLSENPASRAQQLEQMYWIDLGNDVDASELHLALFPEKGRTGDTKAGFTAQHQITGGSDGAEPSAGVPTDNGTYAAAFEQLRAVEDVSIVAAPGHSSLTGYQAIQGLLISHVEQTRAYRIAVLDPPAGQTISEARQERARIDSTRAAFYYPWVVVANPVARPGRADIPAEITLPPSGFICGIYARNDVEQSVAKAPANEIVRGALRFENDINFAQQQVLNPLGINCLRFFAGRGLRVWGARTASSDPEWKYVNVRRFLLYLEASIDRGTQWVVFENNGPRLWANVRETVEAFLYNEWASGNLLGENPKQAYFVRCDRTTMTQNDLDNGRLICLVGVAVLKPAEFVIFRIGQKTADERS